MIFYNSFLGLVGFRVPAQRKGSRKMRVSRGSAGQRYIGGVKDRLTGATIEDGRLTTKYAYGRRCRHHEIASEV